MTRRGRRNGVRGTRVLDKFRRDDDAALFMSATSPGERRPAVSVSENDGRRKTGDGRRQQQQQENKMQVLTPQGWQTVTVLGRTSDGTTLTWPWDGQGATPSADDSNVNELPSGDGDLIIQGEAPNRRFRH
jgi:hypothetical protein